MEEIMTMQNWLEMRETNVRPTSLKTYRSYEQAHILPFFGTMPLAEITVKAVAAFKKQLDKKLAPKTVRDILSYLKTVLGEAEKQGWLKSPRLPGVRLETREKEVLSRSEQRALGAGLAASQNPKDLAVLIGLYTGLRLGEVLGLRVKDIDLEAGVLRVRENSQRVYDKATGRCPVRSLSPKTRSSLRDVPLEGPLKTILARYVKSQPPGSQNRFLLTGKDGRACDARTIQYHFGKIKKAYGLSPGVTFHSLRHSFATRALEAGADMNTVSAFLGHSSVGFTLSCYGHCVTEQKREQMKKIAACF